MWVLSGLFFSQNEPSPRTMLSVNLCSLRQFCNWLTKFLQKSVRFVNGLQTCFRGLCHTRGMTAKLQQRQRERGDHSRRERGSMTRSNVIHPPASPPSNASPRATRLGLRWQSAAATPLSPAPHAPNPPGHNHPHHSSFCWQAELRLRHSSPKSSSYLRNTACNTEINSN